MSRKSSLAARMRASTRSGERYRMISAVYSQTPASVIIPPAQFHDQHELFQCMVCGLGKRRKKFPQNNQTICKACIRKRDKCFTRQRKVSSRVKPGKVNFANKLRRNMTPAESHLWVKLSSLFPAFSCQTVIFGYIADFACLGRKLLIEIDGEYHNDAQQKEYDDRRSQQLKQRGYRIMRFTNEEVMTDRARVLGQIMESL
jgi:very-short-patch-repair endonuclease